MAIKAPKYESPRYVSPAKITPLTRNNVVMLSPRDNACGVSALSYNEHCLPPTFIKTAFASSAGSALHDSRRFCQQTGYQMCSLTRLFWACTNRTTYEQDSNDGVDHEILALKCRQGVEKASKAYDQRLRRLQGRTTETVTVAWRRRSTGDLDTRLSLTAGCADCMMGLS